MNTLYKAFSIRVCSFILAAFSLFSCMPDPIEVQEVPSVKPEMVVATALIPNRAMVVWLTSTFGILEANEESKPEELVKSVAVNDGLVTLSGPSGTDTLVFVENGVYGGLSLSLQEGETLELQVKSEKLGEIRATTTIQPKVAFKSVEANLVIDIYDDTLAQIKYSIADPAEKNWYMINVQKINRKKVGFSMDAINPETFTFLLDDADFNGRVFEEQLELYQEGLTYGDSIAVSLSNISQDYFRFMEFRLDKKLGIFEFLSEPVNYPSNVVGGKGYFNLHHPDVRMFVLTEEDD